MATGVICTPPILQFTLNNGQLAAGGSILTQVGGVNAATFQDQPLAVPLPNPIPLNSRGEISNAAGASCQLFLTPNTVYVFTLFDGPNGTGNQIWSAAYVNGLQITQAVIAAFLYPQSAAEAAQGFTPTAANQIYTYGNVLRYGADPLGVADSSAAWATAISCNDEVFDGYPGGGAYKFNSECTFTNYPLRIRGAVKNIGNVPGVGGTRITLASSVGAGKAHFHTTAFASGIRIENISFFWQDVTLAQFGFRATSDLRASSILDCAFVNTAGTINPAVNAISLEGAVIFTGAIAIRDNYFAGVHTAIALSGPCTTVRIRDNEIYGNLTGTNNGISIGASCLGVSIIGNTIEGWATAGVSNTGVVTQIGNYFEANGKDFIWTTSSNCSIGDFNPAGGSSTYTYNDASGNLVMGGAGYGIFADSQNANISRGIIDKFGTTGGYAAYGVWQTPTFAAGNFTGNGAMTWTVIAGNVSNAEYSVVGNTCNLHLEVDSSTVGGTPSTQLIYQMPLTAVSAAFFPCEVRVNGTRQTAVCQTSAGSKLLAIYVDATRATNWTASAANAGVSVNIAYRVNA